jgi:hypothetical protein
MLPNSTLSNKGTAIPGRRQKEHKYGSIISGCESERDVRKLLQALKCMRKRKRPIAKQNFSHSVTI